jgi:hypothetical protein
MHGTSLMASLPNPGYSIASFPRTWSQQAEELANLGLLSSHLPQADKISTKPLNYLQ